MKILAPFFIFLLLWVTVANSATITRERYGSSEIFFVTISGEINSDDSIKFENIISGISKVIVILDSPGGSVLSGLDIGRRIKSNNFVTAVPGNALCASSCALIWLAGANRYAENNSYVGFHAAYVYKNGKPIESGMGNALVGAYLNSLGLPDSAIIYVTKAPPEGMLRLSRATGEQVGITYSSINDGSFDVKERKDISVKKGVYDPIRTVSRFYSALSNGDGETASSLVIPEKRGIGPFNEKNISSFYGVMKAPLTVQSATRLSEDLVEVRYTYTYTKSQCNGVAKVETQYFMGNTLISRIKANC